MRYKVPGIYLEPELNKVAPINITNECITGFIGIAEKGPINKSVMINSFPQFKKIFGNFTGYSYLAYSVYGFFLSGGKECFVVRIAHIDDADSTNSASKSYLTVKSIDAKPFLKIEALSEGVWGNEVKIDLRYFKSAAVNIIKEIKKDEEEVEVDSTEDFYINDVVCISNNKNKEFCIVKEIKKNKISFFSKIKNDFNFNDSNKCILENLKLNIIITHDNFNEQFLYLSLNPLDKKYFISEINKYSNVINIYKESDCLMPEEVYFSSLNYGKNGILGITAADFIGYFKGLNDHKGLGIFDSINHLSIITAPDVLIFEELIINDQNAARNEIFVVQKAMIEHCEKWGNRFAILDIPRIDDLTKLIKWREKFDTKNAALYYPKIEMINPEDRAGLTSLLVPPSGFIAGAFAECDEKNGIYRIAANIFVKGVVGLERMLDNEEYEIIYPLGINGFKYIPGRGIKIWGARTLSSEPEWKFINVRRTFSLIQAAIKENTGWAVFETNNLNLRKRLVRYITAFLIDIWREGYLTGKVPEEAFFVRCDDELNPQNEIDQGKITVEIGISIAKPSEFLIIRLMTNSESSLVLTE